jgi:hypothetical protein
MVAVAVGRGVEVAKNDRGAVLQLVQTSATTVSNIVICLCIEGLEGLYRIVGFKSML